MSADAGKWILHLICCGRDDGYQVCESWETADAFRGHYTDAVGHDRQAVLSELHVATRLGFHETLPIAAVMPGAQPVGWDINRWGPYPGTEGPAWREATAAEIEREAHLVASDTGQTPITPIMSTREDA